MQQALSSTNLLALALALTMANVPRILTVTLTATKSATSSAPSDASAATDSCDRETFASKPVESTRTSTLISS